MEDNKDINIALLIDVDNISSKYIGSIISELSKYGKITIRHMYGDWTQDRLRPWMRCSAPYSLTPVMQPNNTPGKNSSDIGLIIDAMDILYGGAVQGFCIVSSDGDFNKLATRLREAGKVVIGMGETKTPESFRQSCERFIFLDIIQGQEDEEEDLAPTPKKGRKKAAAKKEKEKDKAAKAASSKTSKGKKTEKAARSSASKNVSGAAGNGDSRDASAAGTSGTAQSNSAAAGAYLAGGAGADTEEAVAESGSTFRSRRTGNAGFLGFSRAPENMGQNIPAGSREPEDEHDLQYGEGPEDERNYQGSDGSEGERNYQGNDGSGDEHSYQDSDDLTGSYDPQDGQESADIYGSYGNTNDADLDNGTDNTDTDDADSSETGDSQGLFTDQKTIENAIVKMITDNNAEGKETGLGEIGSRLVKIYPDFDIRNYHYSKLSEFLKDLPSLQVTNRDNSVWISLKSTSDSEIEKQILSIFRKHDTDDMNIGQLKQELSDMNPNLDATIRKSGVTRFSVYLNRNIHSVEVNGRHVMLVK